MGCMGSKEGREVRAAVRAEVEVVVVGDKSVGKKSQSYSYL